MATIKYSDGVKTQPKLSLGLFGYFIKDLRVIAIKYELKLKGIKEVIWILLFLCIIIIKREWLKDNYD